MYAEPGKGAIHGAKDLRHGDVYLRLGLRHHRFELGSRAKENRILLGEFLDESFVAVRPVTAAVARRYGQVFAQLHRSGTPIPVNDIWIAASTLDSGGHLLTFDDDYRNVASLDCTILKP